MGPPTFKTSVKLLTSCQFDQSIKYYFKHQSSNLVRQSLTAAFSICSLLIGSPKAWVSGSFEQGPRWQMILWSYYLFVCLGHSSQFLLIMVWNGSWMNMSVQLQASLSTTLRKGRRIYQPSRDDGCERGGELERVAKPGHQDQILICQLSWVNRYIPWHPRSPNLAQDLSLFLLSSFFLVVL